MALSKVSGLLGVREAQIAPITADADGAATTWGALAKVTGIKSLKCDPNVKSVENRGDEMLIDAEDTIDYYDISWENAELPLDVLAAINGGEVATTGTGEDEVVTYLYAGNVAQTSEFKLAALAKRGSNGVADVMIEFFRVKGTLTFGFTGEDFTACSFKGKALRTKGTVDSKANALYRLSYAGKTLTIA